jgi:hypothetical protein
MLKKRQITCIFGFFHSENETFVLQKSVILRSLIQSDLWPSAWRLLSADFCREVKAQNKSVTISPDVTFGYFPFQLAILINYLDLPPAS